MEKKIMFIASSGGHLSELLQLKSMMREEDILITENIGDIASLSARGNGIRVRTVKAGSRKQGMKYLWIFFLNTMISMWLFIVEKPDVIISTGSHTFIPFLFARKCMFWRRCEVIYIESIARVHTLSKTGKMCLGRVDTFYVQWESLCALYPEVTYGGRLL